MQKRKQDTQEKTVSNTQHDKHTTYIQTLYMCNKQITRITNNANNIN